MALASDPTYTLSELRSLHVNYYTTLIPFSILLYDYCLTFSAEVERCWGVRRLNWALGFFYLNRYLVLFGHMPIMLEYFWSTANPKKAEICHHLQSFHQYLAIVAQLLVGCMLIMRMYALYERSRKVLAFYVTLATVILVVAFWACMAGKKEDPPNIQLRIGCGASLSRERSRRFGIAWGGMVVFDSIVFGMTLYKSAFSFPNRVNILDILLRDGAIYYGVMVACHLANILTFVLGGHFTRASAVAFTNVISSVMISHLVLNLRDPSLLSKESHIAPTSELTYPLTTIVEMENSTQSFEGTPYPGLPPSRPGRSRAMYH